MVNKQASQNTPFILSTPHHAETWKKSFPQVHILKIQQYRQSLQQYKQAIKQLNTTSKERKLSHQEEITLKTLGENYKILRHQYEQYKNQT